MIGNQSAEKCWNKHCQAEEDADYHIPDLSSICFTVPQKKQQRDFGRASVGRRRNKKTDLYAYKCIQPYTAIKVQHRGSFVHGKWCLLGTEEGKMLDSPSEPPVLGAWSWRRQRCWPCQCTQQFLQGKALSENNCWCCLTWFHNHHPTSKTRVSSLWTFLCYKKISAIINVSSAHLS